MKRFLLPIVVLIISFTAGYRIISIWRGFTFYGENPAKENLVKAARLSPSNPDPFYRLGLFYQWDFRNTDFPKSIQYFSKAIERNPLEQEYWLNLAKVFQKMGDQAASEKALEKAILTFPTGYRGRWMAANFLLQQGSSEKAFSHFTYILANYPNESGLVYDVLYRAINDREFILNKLVPRDPVSMNQYLAYLYESGDKASVKRAWERKTSLGFKSDRTEVLRYIEFLIAHGDISEAFQGWKARLKEEGFSVPSDGNLITNGGFEKEKVLGGGFDWKIAKVPGVDISFDHSIASEGKSSLKITFSGKENVDFQHVSEFVALKPNTEYILKARMKTRGITTKSGIKIEIFGIGGIGGTGGAGTSFHGASESLTGDNGWKELVVSFRTPAQIQGGWVRVRREKTDKFDRFISGTAWLDDVQLKPR